MDTDKISQLIELDYHKQLVFAYLTCERLYPNYVYFSKKFGFGDFKILREAIDYIKLNVFAKKSDEDAIKILIKSIDNVTPLPENFESELASAALDACGVIYEALVYMSDRNSDHIENISKMAIDSVDMYIQDIEHLDFNTDPYFQKKIDTNPLMMKERTIQAGVISFLRKIEHPDFNDIETLLDLQGDKKGKGNLNL